MGGRGKDFGGGSGNGSAGSSEGDAEWWLEGDHDANDFGWRGFGEYPPGNSSPDVPGGGPGSGPGSGPEQDMVDAWAAWQEARQTNDQQGMDQAQRAFEDALIQRDAAGAEGLDRPRLLATLRAHRLGTRLGTWLGSPEGREAVGAGVGTGLTTVAVGGLLLGDATSGGGAGGGGSSPPPGQLRLFDPPEEE